MVNTISLLEVVFTAGQAVGVLLAGRLWRRSVGQRARRDDDIRDTIITRRNVREEGFKVVAHIIFVIVGLWAMTQPERPQEPLEEVMGWLLVIGMTIMPLSSYLNLLDNDHLAEAVRSEDAGC